MEVALNQAREGRLHILGEMARTMSAPRSELSENAPERLSPIVMYGDGSERSASGIAWLQRRLLQLVSPTSTAASTVDDSDAPYDPVAFFFRRVALSSPRVWVMEETAKDFAEIYPFLFGLDSFADLEPLPVHLTDNVYIGSRHVQPSARLLRQLKVTTVICSGEEARRKFDEIPDIHVLAADVADSTSRLLRRQDDLITLLDSMQRQLDAGHVVYLGVMGRSRSASIAAAWLVVWNGQEPDEAVQTIRNAVPSAYVAPAWMNQLRQIRFRRAITQ